MPSFGKGFERQYSQFFCASKKLNSWCLAAQSVNGMSSMTLRSPVTLCCGGKMPEAGSNDDNHGEGFFAAL